MNLPNDIREANGRKQTPPPALWFAVGALAIITLVTLLTARNGYVTIAAFLQAVVLVGLVRGHKWAYVLMIVCTAAGVLTAFGKSVGHGLFVLLCDAIVLVPMLMSTSYFFPENNLTDSTSEPSSTNNQTQGDVL